MDSHRHFLSTKFGLLVACNYSHAGCVDVHVHCVYPTEQLDNNNVAGF